jgi:hypothetical protein
LALKTLAKKILSIYGEIYIGEFDGFERNFVANEYSFNDNGA